MSQRKQKPIWNIALTYYITANLFALIPVVLASFLVAKIATQIWQIFFFTLVFDALGIFGAFKFSADNINKHYIVLEKKKVIRWSMGYLLFFNFIYLTFVFIQTGASLLSVLSSLVIIETALINYVVGSSYIKVNPEDERESHQDNATLPKEESALKNVLRTTLLIISGIVPVLIAPFFLFWVLSVNTNLSSRSIIVIDIFYLFLAIVAIKQLGFNGRKLGYGK